MTSPSTSYPLASQADLLRWEPQIDKILGELSLRQKVGQLHQLKIGLLNKPQSALDEEKLIREGMLGTAVFASTAYAGNERDAGTSWEATERFQRMAVDATGIPMLFARDVIHGHHTMYPIPLGQAASWNPALVEASQRIAAREARGDGLHWAFSPIADIGRDPRWGRVAEGYGEDPYLCGEMTVAAVRGFQRGEYPVLACLKHFAAYGAAEGGRDYARASMGPHELREIYLPPFQRGVEAGVASVMAGFNECDGIPATSNRWLLREVLKEEWGFHGVIVSDWYAIDELMRHGVASNRRDAARIAIESGIDVDMVSGCYLEHLADLVRDGVVKEGLVDDAVRRVLRLKFAMGLFGDPFHRAVISDRNIPNAEAMELSREFSVECCVLLKNKDGVLPLKKSQSIFITGPFVSATSELFGTWAGDGVLGWADSMAQALGESPDLVITAKPFGDSIVENARAAGCAVALLGEHPNRSGEARSVADLGLPPGQIEILRQLALAEVPIISVIFTGRALALAEVSRLSDAVLVAWHPGTKGAHGVADVLLGRREPMGRLPASFPFVTGQVPVHYSRHATGRPLEEPDSRYLDAPAGAQYPFGFGLSYTTLDCRELRIEASSEGRWAIRLIVCNTGSRSTTAAIQLYVRDLVASRARPLRELKRFSKVTIPAGGLQEVGWELTEDDFAFSRADGTWGSEPGEFRVWAGLDSRCGLEGTLRLG